MSSISVGKSHPAVSRIRTVALLLVCLLSAMLIACGGSPKREDPVKLNVAITAADDINPDSSGRPSPVVVAIYQLAVIEAFENGDFFSVFDESGVALGDTLLKREQIVLQPGENRLYEAEFDPAIAYVGVVAAYRNVENATWRAFLEIPTESIGERMNVFSKNHLNISVGALEVALSE